MADSIQIEMTPGQFAQAVQALEAQNNGVKSSNHSGSQTGDVETKDINFSYAYDGAKLCTVTITKRNSFMAKLASLDQIRARMVKMFAANLS